MIPDEIRRKRDELSLVACRDVHWCSDQELAGENMAGVSPGGDLNHFGWYVIGTTGGGNAVVVRADEPAVYFADHEWCDDGTAEGVRRELIPLSASIEEFRQSVAEIDDRLDEIG